MTPDPRQAAHAALDALLDAMAAVTRAQADPDAPDRLLSVDEAADRLGIGRSLVYDEIGRGRLRSCSVGRRRLIPASAVAAYAAGPPGAER